MEYVILTILVVILICVVILIIRKNNNNDVYDKMSKLELSVVKELGTFKADLAKEFNNDFLNLDEKIENRLRMINDHVNERLDQNFEKTNKTFTSVLERLSKIDEAQKKIDTLSNDIVSLQGILTDKKTRGIFGELTCKILWLVFLEKTTKKYIKCNIV